MPLDDKIETAIKTAVAEVNQSPELAAKLVAWIGELTAGNSKLTDNDSVRRHLQLLFSTLEARSTAKQTDVNDKPSE